MKEGWARIGITIINTCARFVIISIFSPNSSSIFCLRTYNRKQILHNNKSNLCPTEKLQSFKTTWLTASPPLTHLFYSFELNINSNFYLFKTVLTTWLQASPPLTHCLRASSTSLVRFVTAINTEAARPSLLSDTISSLEPLDIVSFSWVSPRGDCLGFKKNHDSDVVAYDCLARRRRPTATQEPYSMAW